MFIQPFMVPFMSISSYGAPTEQYRMKIVISYKKYIPAISTRGMNESFKGMKWI